MSIEYHGFSEMWGKLDENDACCPDCGCTMRCPTCNEPLLQMRTGPDEENSPVIGYLCKVCMTNNDINKSEDGGWSEPFEGFGR